MFEYIQGTISEIAPSYIVIDNKGIGYFINISLTTYSKINKKTECKVYVHQIIREDAHFLYGFESKLEREVFRKLISVSGIGPNTARLFLSSMLPEQIISAIDNGEVNVLQSVKGIGQKTAQRAIIELKDKLVLKELEYIELKSLSLNNSIVSEATSALEMLGFPKKQSQQVIGAIFKNNDSISLETLIKEALKRF